MAEVTFWSGRLHRVPELTKVMADRAIDSTMVIFQIGELMVWMGRDSAAELLREMEAGPAMLIAEATDMTGAPAKVAIVEGRDGTVCLGLKGGWQATAQTTQDKLVEVLRGAVAHLDRTAHLARG